jgi:diaminopimelate decarboxylase
MNSNKIEVGKEGHLMLHGVDSVDICSKYGTPLFVFDQVILEETFERFRNILENNYSKVMVCYSIKTNSNLAICQILSRKGAFAEVTSDLDLHVALKAGFSGQRIIFDGIFKPKETLKKAIEAGVLLINVESFTEMERLDNLAEEMGVKQAIGIRINPFKDSGLSKYFDRTKLTEAAYCNLESRFGFSVDEAYLIFEQALKYKNLRIEAIMAHPYRVATKVLLPMVLELRKKFGIKIKYLNVGGGFSSGDVQFIGNGDLVKDFLRRKMGLKSKLTELGKLAEIESVVKCLMDEIKQKLGNSSDCTVIVEPGRLITSSSGIVFSRIDHIKNAGGYRWAIIDAGTNLLPRFTAMEMRKVVVANNASSNIEEEVNVVGPLLYNEDFIILKTGLPKINEGDILSIFDCGSYTLSRSNQFLHARPAVVLINSKGEIKVIRKKETCDDFLFQDRST